jgi:hypothetical protein
LIPPACGASLGLCGAGAFVCGAAGAYRNSVEDPLPPPPPPTLGGYPGYPFDHNNGFHRGESAWPPPPPPDALGCSGGRQAKTKKIMYDVTENDEFDREEIATYEEVARLFPRPGIYRPVVLIGPPGVGRNELKRRLIALDPDRYKATIPRK